MDIEVRVTYDEFEEIHVLSAKYDNEQITEEEYADGLQTILGKRLHHLPGKGDNLHIVVGRKTQVQAN